MIRAFLRFAIDKPIINHILLILIFVLALISYQKIPKELFPPSQLDRIVIKGHYSGASVDVLDKLAVTDIEEELSKLASIDEITSKISSGSFTIKSDIKPGEEPLLVLSDAKDVIAKIKSNLPSDMDEPIARIEVHQFPLMLVAISAKESNVSIARLIEVAKAIKNRLSGLYGIGDIEIRGERDKIIKVVFDESKLAAYGISKFAFIDALKKLSFIYPAGSVVSKGKQLFISSKQESKDAKTLAQTIVQIDGKKIRLGDVASVYEDYDDAVMLSHYNAKANISLNINKTKEGNAIALSKEIKRIIKEELSKRYPDVVIDVYTDTSIWIKNRLNLVSSNIFFGLLLVALALFLSVNARIALVVAIGIPTSFMIALISADMLGQSLNMLTLLGALIALGMLVDEAIVVAENIYRHIEMGKDARSAAIEGAAEMFPAVLTATATTIFAFLPLLIMSGKLGVFMSVLPVMISILLLSSLFEAFYFLPLHAKEIFSAGPKRQREIGEDKVRWFWERFRAGYANFLYKLLTHKKTALFVLVSLIVSGTFYLVKATKFQLFPEFDAQQIYITGQLKAGSDITVTERRVFELEHFLLSRVEANETASITSVIGFLMNPDQSTELGKHLFHLFIDLHERTPQNLFDRYIAPIFSLEYDDSDMIRTKSAKEIAAQLKDEVMERFLKTGIFEELEVYVPQTGIVGHDIEISLGAPQEKLFAAIAQLKEALSKIKGVSEIYDNVDLVDAQIKVTITPYGQQLGFSEGHLLSVLRGAFANMQMAKIFGDSGVVSIKVESARRRVFDALREVEISLPSKKGFVKIGEIADIERKKDFITIYKEKGERNFSLYASVDKDRVTPGEVIKAIEPLLDRLKKEGVRVILKGEEKKKRQIKKEMTLAAVIAIFLIFLALVWMFDALLLPLIVLSTIPLSVLGALLGAKMMGLNLTLPGVMGLIGLAGVVVNDALIMLDFIRKSRDLREITRLASYRLRPILLTSVTTLLGLSSLIFFASGQALILQPMAVSLGFGLAWATILNLFFVPLAYAVIYRIDLR